MTATRRNDIVGAVHVDRKKVAATPPDAGQRRNMINNVDALAHSTDRIGVAKVSLPTVHPQARQFGILSAGNDPHRLRLCEQHLDNGTAEKTAAASD